MVERVLRNRSLTLPFFYFFCSLMLLPGCGNLVVGGSSNTNAAVQSQISFLPASGVNNGSTPITVTVTISNASGGALSNKAVTLSSIGTSSSITPTISPASATTNSSGIATFTVTSSSAGYASLQASVSADHFTGASLGQIQFLSALPVSDWQARMNAGSSNSFSSTLTNWQDLENTSLASPSGVLKGSSRWSGSGSIASPYAFATNSGFVDFGFGLNNYSSFTFESWLMPTSLSSLETVILGNGQTHHSGLSTETNLGLTLKQSPLAVNSQGVAGALQLTLGEKSYSDEVMALSPVGYWRLGESSGATAYDSSGKGKHGVYQGGATLGQAGAFTGDPHPAALLDGSTGYIQTTYTQTAVTAYSVSAWIKTTSTALLPIIQDRGSGAGNSLTLVIGLNGTYGGIGRLSFVVDSNSVWVGPTASSLLVNDGNWHHIVGTWSAPSGMLVAASQFNIYIDGNAQALSTPSQRGAPQSPLSGLGTAIIGYHSTWVKFWNGQIQDVAIFETELSAAQAQSLYYAGLKRTTCTSQSALANNTWHFISGLWNASTTSLQLFVDGTQECTVIDPSGGYSGSSNSFRIGADSLGNHPWAGSISEVRTYGSALSSGNILTNKAATLNRYP